MGRVKDVYERREAQDSKSMAERDERYAQRDELRVTKAKQIFEDRDLQRMQRTDIQNTRMMESELKRLVIEAEAREKVERFETLRAQQLEDAKARADDTNEQKRETA